MDSPETTAQDRAPDRWGGRAEVVRVVLRFIGVGAFVFVIVRRGTLHDAPWVVGVTAASCVLMVVTAVLRAVRRFDGWTMAVIAAMMLGGAVINPHVDYLGTVLFVVGGSILVGQPEVPPQVGIAVVSVIGLVTLGVAGYAERSWGVVLSIGAGTLAIGLFGALRRQARIREAQDRVLAARSRELEVRNAELVAQTEATRRETARAAALDERSRIARDLHDVLAHALGGLVVQLEAADAELAAGDQQAAATRLTACRRLAVDGLQDARTAVQQLRSETSPGEDAADVVGALSTVFRGPVGLQLGVVFEVVGSTRPCSVQVVEALAAVAREAATNVNKHAPGCPVAATVVFDDDAVRLEVVNGLSAVASELAASGNGIGLVGLAERVQACGGELSAGIEGRRWVVSARCPSP